MNAGVQPLPPESRRHRWLGIACLAAINLRWFMPTEATAEGATLWLATLWCLLAAVAAWQTISADAIARRWTRADAAVALLVAGHVLSGVLVLINGGQRQLAGNLLGEWVGVAAVWSIARDFVRVPWFRAALWQTTLMSLVLLGAYGAWQHWVELPGMASRLGAKFDAVRAVRASGGTDPAERELAREGVPMSEPEFTLFEKRLRDSREPFGFFALANTLGGFLAAGMLLLLADGVRRTDRSAANSVLIVVTAALMGVGLLLTKSRTALVGLVLVSAITAGLRAVLSPKATAIGRKAVAFGGALLGVALVAAALVTFGSLDRETFAEAPKSLLYRWQYWTGTARLIAEHPVLGGGLGQFRSAYLRVKEPAASEEIADPHNFLLDVWYNGGLLAAAGAIWLAATILVTTVKAARTTANDLPARSASATLLFAGASSPWIMFAVQLWGEGIWDDRLLVVGALLMGWAGLIATGRASFPQPSRAACGLSALVLLTHLLGAGGIAYAAVMQLLVILLAGTFSAVSDDAAPPVIAVWSWLRRGSFAIAMAVTFLLWDPFHRSLLDEADALAARGAPRQTVREAYAKAKSGNPWDPLPRARLAELAYRELQDRAGHSGKLSPEEIAEATRYWLPTIQRDPANGVWRHRLGEIELEWAQRDSSVELATLALGHLQEAVDRYPTNARWLADLSDAAATAAETDRAARAAAAALAQDQINQRFGHVERILAAEVRERLSGRVPSPQ